MQPTCNYRWRKVLIAALLCTAALVSDVACASSEEATGWIQAAQGVLQRLIPEHSADFVFEIVNATPSSSPLPGLENDYFTVSAANGVVTVQGTSGVSLTSGAYWYLKNVTNCQVTWGNNGTGNQLSLPTVLPDVASTTVSASVPVRYGWNMCTFSYSGVWWDEERWQREIDWMALHGVNFPLALTGQEYVWLKVFEDYNVTLEQLESWFSGPAFLAWQRAGNIRGFAGPLSYHWLTQQANLQKFILAQMRSLGMKPILACFAGHVPQVAISIWPNATFTQSASWNHFSPNETDVWYLDPSDPLFPQLGALFTEKMMDIFGTDHYYSCDTFNEVDPKSTDHTYLKAASAAVHQSIAAKDPSGIWVMQAWLFHSSYWNTPGLVEAYLSGVSNESMLILDLNSEAGVLAPKYNQYYGKPWVWNMLHNYGGVRGVYGNLTEIANAPYVSLHTPDSTMIGLGFTPEAIEQNPVMYEMLTSTFWSSTPIDVEQWLKAYVRQRYGSESAPMWAAWQLLFSAVYNQPGEPRSEIEWVPHWQQASFGWQNGDATLMFQAAVAFLDAVGTFPDAESNGPLMYDLVDIIRQAATMFFSDLHRQLSNEGWAAETRQLNATATLAAIGQLQLDLISTLDTLFSTNPNYLLGVWTTGATDLGLENETLLYLYNAKNQITLWGPNAQICDYAAKAWSGLYSTYYHRRWSFMLERLLSFSESQSSYWNGMQYENELLVVEKEWCSNGSATFPRTPNTILSPVRTAQQLIDMIHVSASTLAQDYQILQNTDGLYADYPFTPTWGHNPQQLALLCNMMDDCAGFTGSGFLKKSIQVVNATGSTLYVKRRSLKRSLQRHLEQPQQGSSWRDAIEEAVSRRAKLLEAEIQRKESNSPRNPREAAMRKIPGHSMLFRS